MTTESVNDPTPEPEKGELVTAQEPAGPNQAIDRAAEHAMANPGAPGASEFFALAAQARILSMSGAAPKEVRDDPYVAFHLALVGRDFGISLSAAMTLIDIIPGAYDRDLDRKTYQFSLSPQLMNAQIRRLGLGQIIPAVRTATRCVAVCLRPGGNVDHRCAGDNWPNHVENCGCSGIIGESEFTWEDARMAGLVGGSCQPGEHVKETRKGRGGSTYQTCGCNQGYITYPKRMMWWRSSGFAADDWFPEAGLGMYSSEALGAAVDEHGRAIDPATVALPEGYGPVDEPATETDRENLKTRIGELPAETRSQLADAWKTGDPGANRPVLNRLDDLKATEVPVASDLITYYETHQTVSNDPQTGDDIDTAEGTPDEAEAATETQPETVKDQMIARVAERVKKMVAAEVDAQLNEAGIEPEGNLPTRRALLTRHIVETATA